uniref:Uncharacterized protein n=1 Tax=Rhizophora mucronata TaxID=61149 RepID=A0A2P2N2J1_RHIMU
MKLSIVRFMERLDVSSPTLFFREVVSTTQTCDLQVIIK